MKPTTMRSVAIACAVVCGVASVALAQQSGSVAWIGGGVGEESRVALEQAARGYNLKVVGTLANGAYVGDIQVVVRATGGDALIDVAAGGPILYARLPAGSYTVVVRAMDQERQSAVTLSAEGRQTRVVQFTMAPGASPAVPFNAAAEKNVSLYDLVPEAANSKAVTSAAVIEAPTSTPSALPPAVPPTVEEIEIPQRAR